jgi:hypothetical protein
MTLSNRHPERRGQVLIIVAFAMVVLMGIGAIVIDLGLSWMLRRHEQNAADPASIAAAAYIEEGDNATTRAKMHTAACFYAKENGFFQSDDVTCAAARAVGDLQVHWPPTSGDFAGNTGMVQVVISAEHPSFFGAIFGRDRATVATGAVAAREQTSANSNSLVALHPDQCAAGKTHGNGTVTIDPVVNPETGEDYNGGYVHVNSTCNNGSYNDECSNGSGGFKQGGNAGTQIIAPMIYINGTCEQSGGEVASPVTEGAGVTPDPMAGLHGPRQQDYPAGHCPRKQGSMIVYDQSTPASEGCKWSQKDTTVTLTPGVYWGGWDFSGQNVTVRLQEGIYIIAGGGVSIKGTAEVDSTPAVIGGDPLPGTDPARVLIFSTDNTTDPACSSSTDARCIQGAIAMSGQSSMRLWGLDSGPWQGLLMWQDKRASNPDAPISLTGQGVLDLAGTIYAPLADVKITGNGEAEGTRLAVQVISYTWDIGGNGDLYMPYDPSQLYHFVQQGLVH